MAYWKITTPYFTKKKNIKLQKHLKTKYGIKSKLSPPSLVSGFWDIEVFSLKESPILHPGCCIQQNCSNLV